MRVSFRHRLFLAMVGLGTLPLAVAMIVLALQVRSTSSPAGTRATVDAIAQSGRELVGTVDTTRLTPAGREAVRNHTETITRETTLARRAEQMIERVASKTGVPWSFQVWQGRPEAASLLQAFGAEILSLGRISSRVSSRMLVPARRPTPPSRETDTTSISVLFSGSEQAARAVATACSLARDMGARLTVMLPAAVPALKEQALAILKQHGQVARFIELAGVDAQSLRLAADASGPGILITEAEHPLLQQVGLEQCLDALFCPVLLIR